MIQQNNVHCLIWPEFPARSVVTDSIGQMTTVYGSERAGGDYKLTPQIAQWLTNPFDPIDERTRARLTTMLGAAREQGVSIPEITGDAIKRAQSTQDIPVDGRADRLLWYLQWSSHSVGQVTDTSPNSAHIPGLLAFTESVRESEIAFLEDYLRSQGWINGSPGYPIVSVRGYARVSVLRSGHDSDQVFVAMWFSDEMERVYEEAIDPAIRAAGLTPYLVGQGKSPDRIEDEAETAIRRTRLVIADFTHDPGTGVRGSVYYEAGFARALYKPIIYTAKIGSDVHFNVDHFLRIEWEDANDLLPRLTQRIRNLPELQQR